MAKKEKKLQKDEFLVIFYKTEETVEKWNGVTMETVSESYWQSSPGRLRWINGHFKTRKL
jgi:hypothetical protein